MPVAAMMLVTGATGSVGEALCAELTRRGLAFRPTSRGRRFGHVETGPLTAGTDWSRPLRGVDVVIHLAGPGREPAGTQDAVAAAAALARQAAVARVLRFVFVSTLAVNGSESPAGRAFSATDPPAPRDDFARGKLAVEEALREVAAEAGLSLAIIRPAPVYGPGGGVLMPIIAAVAAGKALPVGALRAKRSYCAIGNLVDVLVGAAVRPGAAGKVLFAADAAPIDAPSLVRAIAGAMGVRPRLRTIPPVLLEAAMRMVGGGTATRELTRPLLVDLEETIRVIGHQPPLRLSEGLAAALARRMPPRQ